MNTDQNSSAPIRAGEELPIEALTKYLNEHVPNSQGNLVVEQFPDLETGLVHPPMPDADIERIRIGRRHVGVHAQRKIDVEGIAYP